MAASCSTCFAAWRRRPERGPEYTLWSSGNGIQKGQPSERREVRSVVESIDLLERGQFYVLDMAALASRFSADPAAVSTVITRLATPVSYDALLTGVAA